MSELSDTLIEEFEDKEVRNIYCNDFSNSVIAMQIKVLREQRGLTQSQLAELTGMKQSRISALEDVNYEGWSIKTLRKLAEAFDVALSVRFDSFGEKLREIVCLSKQSLEKPSFEDDPIFKNSKEYLFREDTNDPFIYKMEEDINLKIGNKKISSYLCEILSTDPLNVRVNYKESSTTPRKINAFSIEEDYNLPNCNTSDINCYMK